MNKIDVRDGEKFAIVTLPLVRVGDDVPDVLELLPGLWVTREMPIAIPARAQHWAGTADLEHLAEEASLFLFTKKEAARPDLVDEENRELMDRLRNLHWSLIVDDVVRFEDKPVAISGANQNGELDIRSRQDLELYRYSLGTESRPMTKARLERAAVLDVAMDGMACPPKFPRIGRAIFAFERAMKEVAAWDRLHQAVRCIDGFINTDVGNGKSQFKGRTELFVGPRHHAVMEEIYSIRSATEHMHGWASAVQTVAEERRPRTACLRSLQAETIARACLRHLVKTKALWKHFDDDDALKAFWKLDANTRVAAWGPPLVDLDVVAEQFERWYWDDDDPTCRH